MTKWLNTIEITELNYIIEKNNVTIVTSIFKVILDKLNYISYLNFNL